MWSVGTVLFEMISGKPPFNGENHIDLLRNIQRKAVRLPPDVKVSKECVTLFRILLNRNPLSRAGFKEFLEACDAFVALGCEGAKSDDTEASNQPSMKMMDLGTIHEVDNDAGHGAASMMTTETTAHETQTRKQHTQPPVTGRSEPITITKPVPGFVTPPFGPMTTPSAPFSGPPADLSLPSRGIAARGYHPFAPLEPSPPQMETPFSSTKNPSLPFIDSMSSRGSSRIIRPKGASQQNDSNSSEESEFVMVDYTSPTASGTELVASGSDRRRDGRLKLKTSPPTSPRYLHPQGSVLSSRGDYLIVNDSARQQVSPKGILSTSPGTGGALMGMMGGSRARLMNQSGMQPPNFDAQIESAAKMIATAEDVGRRAISVAHLGDARAYMAMRLVNEEGSVLLTGGPMEGVEEESDSANVTDCEDASATSKESRRISRQRSMSMTDRSMASVKETDDDNEEMPFAVPTEAPSSPVAKHSVSSGRIVHVQAKQVERYQSCCKTQS